MYRRYSAEMADSKLRVIVFLGSTREGRIGLRVTKFIQRQLEERKYHVDVFGQKQSSKVECEEKIRKADAYVVVSAEYNHSIPPALANMLNHFGSSNFSYKPTGIVTYSPGVDEIRTINAPAFADSITEGDMRWEKAVGDSVQADEVVGEIETDKTNMPVHSPVAGVIEQLLVKDGDMVTASKPLFKLRVGAGAAAAAPKKEATAPPPPKTEAASPPPSSPAAGPIPSVAPPPPSPPPSPVSSTPTSAVRPKAAAPIHIGGSRSEQRVKMNRMRQRIAQRLKDSQNTCAMLTTFNEIDMSNVMEMRTLYKDAFQKRYNLKLGFMSAFVKAAAFALSDQPVVNAVIDDLDIVYRDYIDISVAVATPKGLVVPVIRNVESMNYADIEKSIADLGDRARAGTLAIEDMDGGTFTISNGGVFGSMFGTPIINPPQSAILGMHGIFDRPVAVKGQVQIRPMMYVALTYDHRLIDGREAVTFLRKIKSAVEDPRTILLDL